MTKDEIYEHLAQVYLGKQKKIDKKRKRSLKPKVLIQGIVLVILLGSSFYGLTAFFSKKNTYTPTSIIFALNNSPIRVKYNFNQPYPQREDFALPIPKIDATKYKKINFSIRGTDDGFPGIVKVVLRNRKNENSFYFVQNVGLKWQKLSIPLEEFSAITDWTNLRDISFVLESWNVERKRGAVLIDEICFTN
ncbi:MAG: hypothetical protein WC676_07825 [Candidatus Omnitrophota bacterium]